MMMAFALPLLAGCALVAQNAVMAAMQARGLGLVSALMVNSFVGLAFLGLVALATQGSAPFGDVARLAQAWFVIPGLLGTLFVFASLRSYHAIGAASTIALITAAQMLSGILLDATGAYVFHPRPLDARAWVGAALLICGVALIVSRRT
jgi:bacterial/archaeal transporter family-2 protein